MVRGRRRRSEQSALEAAVVAVVGGASYASAAELTGVPRSTVRDYVVRRGIVRERVPKPGRKRVGGITAAAALAAASTTGGHLPEDPGVMARERTRRADSSSVDDREEIRVGIETGESDDAIARRIGRHRSTVWREITANGGRAHYRAAVAEARAAHASSRPKQSWTKSRPWLWEAVQELLRTKKWSPEQIAERLRKEHPDEPEWWVSHEAMYQAIFVQAKPELRKELARCLRSGRARRRPRTRTS